MTNRIKYPKIKQFRSVIKEVKYHNDGGVLPTLKFRGTVKLHGSNSSIILDGNNIYYQSRNRLITLDNDNMGFARFMTDIGEENIMKMYHDISHHDFDNISYPITIYGEFVGKGIQKGVAVSELDKMFVIFGIRYGDNDDSTWADMNKLSFIEMEKNNIHNIMKFPTFDVDINLGNPQLIQNELIRITEEIENECPVGRYFGVSGIGEGAVFSCIEEGYNSSRFRFKSKGERHQSSRIKKLVEVDMEKVNSILEFIEMTVTEKRLQQGISYLNEMNIELTKSSTPHFLRWIVNDINDEEKDRIEASGLFGKDLNRDISTKARSWWLNYLDGEF